MRHRACKVEKNRGAAQTQERGKWLGAGVDAGGQLIWPPVAQAAQIGFRFLTGDAAVVGGKVTTSVTPLDVASPRQGRGQVVVAGRVPEPCDHRRISRSGIFIRKTRLNTNQDCQEITQQWPASGSATISDGGKTQKVCRGGNLRTT